MRVFSDDLKYAQKIFPDIKYEKRSLSKQLNLEYPFLKDFFNHKKLYISNSVSYSFIKLALLRSFSNQSQFDLLINLNKAYKNLTDSILCLADSGKNFHGYNNRNWKTVSGNLHLSILKKPEQEIKNFSAGFTIIAAISVLQTLDLIPELKNKASIKWINDIYIENSKISGVITKSQTTKNIINTVLFGIGLNIDVAPEIQQNYFVKKTTCIKNLISDNNEYNITYILKLLLQNLEKNYLSLLNAKYDELYNLYCERSHIIGRRVIIYSDSMYKSQKIIAKGKVLDIGKNLELYLENQKEPVNNGRIILE